MKLSKKSSFSSKNRVKENQIKLSKKMKVIVRLLTEREFMNRKYQSREK